MMFKKAQAAMEFLMTYGWAILVVLVVIGALSYFGVLSPATLLPEKCTFPVSVSCTDHIVGSAYVGLIIQNGAGRDMTIRGVTATSEALATVGGAEQTVTCSTVAGGAAPTLTDTCPSNPGVIGTAVGCSGGSILRNGGNTDITMSAGDCSFNDIGRDKSRYNVTIFYSWLDSQDIMHKLPGELFSRGP